MLKLDKISVSFPDFKLNEVSLNIQKGEYHVLLGPSGSGKTLILNCIAGFQKTDSGKIIYNDINITDLPPNKRNISFLFQELALFPHLNVKQNIEYPLKVKRIKKQERIRLIDEYLDFTEISNLKCRNIDKLSGGEKQRVALARNLVTKTGLLLLDEPFSAIDSQLIVSLKKLLKKISAQGITIIHVTHNFEEAVNMANKISVIDNGKILQSGNMENIFNSPKNKFIAMFSGNKNYFSSDKLINSKNHNYILINKVSQKNDSPKTIKLQSNNLSLPEIPEIEELKKDYVFIEISEINSENIIGIIIDNNNILISENRIISSARNNFEGVVNNIFPTKSGYDIEVYCGINLWVSMTKHSFEEMEIKSGKKIFLSFKASAVKVI